MRARSGRGLGRGGNNLACEGKSNWHEGVEIGSQPSRDGARMYVAQKTRAVQPKPETPHSAQCSSVRRHTARLERSVPTSEQSGVGGVGAAGAAAAVARGEAGLATSPVGAALRLKDESGDESPSELVSEPRTRLSRAIRASTASASAARPRCTSLRTAKARGHVGGGAYQHWRRGAASKHRRHLGTPLSPEDRQWPAAAGRGGACGAS